MPVTDAAQATTTSTISTRMGLLMRSTQLNGRTFGGYSASDATVGYMVPRLFQTSIAATAGGEIVAVDVGPPAVAGYQSCMTIMGIWSDTTQAALTTTWAASAGALDNGLATLDVSTTANLVAPEYSPGLSWQSANDNVTLQVAAAAGQCAASQAFEIIGTYHYET